MPEQSAMRLAVSAQERRARAAGPGMTMKMGRIARRLRMDARKTGNADLRERNPEVDPKNWTTG